MILSVKLASFLSFFALLMYFTLPVFPVSPLLLPDSVFFLSFVLVSPKHPLVTSLAGFLVLFCHPFHCCILKLCTSGKDKPTYPPERARRHTHIHTVKHNKKTVMLRVECFYVEAISLFISIGFTRLTLKKCGLALNICRFTMIYGRKRKSWKGNSYNPHNRVGYHLMGPLDVVFAFNH